MLLLYGRQQVILELIFAYISFPNENRATHYKHFACPSYPNFRTYKWLCAELIKEGVTMKHIQVV